MKQFTPEHKHAILLEYAPQSDSHSFAALARRHSIKGGRQTVHLWYQRWDGSIASLQHKKGAGRPCLLDQQQVKRFIAAPIHQLNQSSAVVRYGKIAEQVRRKTHTSISNTSVRRIGLKQLGAKKIVGKKRSAEECK